MPLLMTWMDSLHSMTFQMFSLNGQSIVSLLICYLFSFNSIQFNSIHFFSDALTSDEQFSVSSLMADYAAHKTTDTWIKHEEEDDDDDKDDEDDEDDEGEDEDEYLRDGECEICEREMPLTKVFIIICFFCNLFKQHHTIPRELHARYVKKGYIKKELNQGIYV